MFDEKQIKELLSGNRAASNKRVIQTDEPTPYEEDKLKKKQMLVRDSFEMVGKYNMPLIKKQNIDLDKIEPWSYVKTKQNDVDNKHKTIHFFTYDWLFETVYNKPEEALEKLDQYYALLTPDFSMYFDMPRALQIYSTFKNRWCGAFWQKQGMRVIPTVACSDEASYDFCFDGIEVGSVVAVTTYARRKEFKKEFLRNYDKMLEVLKPSAIVCYGEAFDEMRGNIRAYSAFNHEELIAKLGLSEYTRKRLNGELYPSN
ncbi:MAG: DUF4417 domain-containing protein [Firmicutes bacterium]|nr:DUF4417 domain-containing protein [Bacillota bacterium]